jgi:hypothetical protein
MTAKISLILGYASAELILTAEHNQSEKADGNLPCVDE